MLLVFNTKDISLSTKTGAMEKYEPTDEVKELCEKAEALSKKRKEKLEELQKTFDEFVMKEIKPGIEEISKQVSDINIKNNPELAKLQQQSQE